MLANTLLQHNFTYVQIVQFLEYGHRLIAALLGEFRFILPLIVFYDKCVLIVENYVSLRYWAEFELKIMFGFRCWKKNLHNLFSNTFLFVYHTFWKSNWIFQYTHTSNWMLHDCFTVLYFYFRNEWFSFQRMLIDYNYKITNVTMYNIQTYVKQI